MQSHFDFDAAKRISGVGETIPGISSSVEDPHKQVLRRRASIRGLVRATLRLDEDFTGDNLVMIFCKAMRIGPTCRRSHAALFNAIMASQAYSTYNGRGKFNVTWNMT